MSRETTNLMKELLSAAIIGYHIVLTLIGALTLLFAALAARDWYRCKRYSMESEREEVNG